MNDRARRPLILVLLVAFVAPFYSVLPAWSTDIPGEQKALVRAFMTVGWMGWLAVLWWVLA